VDPDRDDALRLRRGDPGGLAGLMERHQDRLFRYLRRLLGDETVAEDLFQQTWLRVADRIRRYDASRPFAPWLLAVARNLAYDHLRARRPESLEEHPEAERSLTAGDPLRALVTRQRDDRLAAALAEVGTGDREVLGLRFQEELGLPDLARVLGVPLPTAKARLYRALTRLRSRLLARGRREDWS
jgi:RNA polymerase sigma-70 factor (ECF subfamily)